jgi:Ca2+-binding RTX toxin-like protein
MAKTTNPKFIKEVIELTNKERQKFGLSTLESNGKLDKAAQGHSKNMAVEDFYSHRGQDGSYAGDRIDKAGYKAETWGENIAIGQSTPHQVVEDWMDSSTHRGNILNPDYQDIGMGYYYLKNDPGYYDYGSYWTQNFGTPEDGNDWWSKYQNFDYGDEGNDKLKGSKQNDYLNGYEGNDTITGAAGDDQLRGGQDGDLIKGGSGNDKITGGDGFICPTFRIYIQDPEDASDKLYGEDGNDLIQGDGGNDLVDGGKGKDILWGDDGNDTVLGMNGSDAISGGDGNDSLEGGKGNDALWGDEGADTLIGVDAKSASPGKGERDTLTGGRSYYWGDGKDTFILGDGKKVYYDDGKNNNPGKGDYALIRNFNADEDIIQLHGTANDYALKNSPRGMPSGTAIFLDTAGKDELIGIVADVSDLDIKADYFKFV